MIGNLLSLRKSSAVSILSIIQVLLHLANALNEISSQSPLQVENNNISTTPPVQHPPHKPPQLSCTKDPSICNEICGETERLPYSATFCSPSTGSCVCDCRDRLKKECAETPFTPCFQGCVKANPNPDAFLYRGGNCPISLENGTVAYQCACECTVRDDYDETNDIL